MDMRHEYELKITKNGRKLSRVIIDQHYKKKHSSKVNDHTILELVKTLNDEVLPVDREEDGYQYFLWLSPSCMTNHPTALCWSYTFMTIF